MFRALLTLQQRTRLSAGLAACARPRLLSCVARPLAAAAAAAPGSSTPAAAAVPAATTSFGPKHITVSRVPISKRAQRAAAEAAAKAAAAAAAAAAGTAAAPAAASASPVASSSSPKPSAEDVDQSFLATAAASYAATPAPPAAAAAPAAPTKKLNAEQLAAQFPWSRNISAHQPPTTSDANAYLSESWFITPEMEASPPPLYTVPPSRFATAPATQQQQPGSSTPAPRVASDIVRIVPEAYIASVSHLQQFQRYLSRSDCVGVDTEFVSAFRYRPRLELIQVSTAEMLGVIDVSLLRAAPEFKVFLAQLLAKEWIVHSHRGDLEVMYDLAASLDMPEEARVPRGLFDTQVAWSFLSTLPSVGYAAMLASLFPGFTIDKSATLSDWTLRPLTQKQISYALGDVQFLMEARRMLEQALQQSSAQSSALQDVIAASTTSDAVATAAPGPRLAWFREEMRLLLNPLLYARPDPTLAYSSLWGSRKFDAGSAGLRVFQSLAWWREVLAARLDQSPGRLLSNDQLQSIAESPPSSTDELSQVPNMKRYTVAQWGAEILAVVNAARAAHQPEAQLNDQTGDAAANPAANTGQEGARILIGAVPSSLPPVFPSLPLSHREASRLHWDLYSLLSSLVDSRSRAMGLSPFVLAPRRDMLDLAAATPAALRVAKQWQHEGVGLTQSSPFPVPNTAIDAASAGGLPAGFRPSLMPSAVNYRFAAVSEEMVFERLNPEEAAEAEEEAAEAEEAPAAVVAAEEATAAAVAKPAPASPAASGDRVALSLAAELTLLSRSKLLRGWRRQLIGDSLLRITEGAPIAWTWQQGAEQEGLGEAKIKE